MSDDDHFFKELHPNLDTTSSLPVCTENDLAFHVFDSIGTGRFATVYKAKYDGKTVAYKQFKKIEKEDERNTDGEYNIRHRKRELLLMASDVFGQCEWIVRCLAIVRNQTGEGRCGLVFEMMAGDLLHRVLYRNVPFESNYICIWSWQIASGIQFLHARNLIHRDINPANILITDDLKICKISDLGIVTRVDNTTTCNGTDQFCAPEVKNEGDGRNRSDRTMYYTLASDVYSLGLTMAAIRDKEEEISKVSDRFRLEGLIAECLKVEPSERISISDVVKKLEKKKKMFCSDGRAPQLKIVF